MDHCENLLIRRRPAHLLGHPKFLIFHPFLAKICGDTWICEEIRGGLERGFKKSRQETRGCLRCSFNNALRGVFAALSKESNVQMSQ